MVLFAIFHLFCAVTGLQQLFSDQLGEHDWKISSLKGIISHQLNADDNTFVATNQNELAYINKFGEISWLVHHPAKISNMVVFESRIFTYSIEDRILRSWISDNGHLAWDLSLSYNLDTKFHNKFPASDIAIDHSRGILNVLANNCLHFVEYHGVLQWEHCPDNKNIVLSHIIGPRLVETNQDGVGISFDTRNKVAVGCIMGKMPSPITRELTLLCRNTTVVIVHHATKKVYVDLFPGIAVTPGDVRGAINPQLGSGPTIDRRAKIPGQYDSEPDLYRTDYFTDDIIYAIVRGQSDNSFRPIVQVLNLRVDKLSREIKVKQQFIREESYVTSSYPILLTANFSTISHENGAGIVLCSTAIKNPLVTVTTSAPENDVVAGRMITNQHSIDHFYKPTSFADSCRIFNLLYDVKAPDEDWFMNEILYCDNRDVQAFEYTIGFQQHPLQSSLFNAISCARVVKNPIKASVNVGNSEDALVISTAGLLKETLSTVAIPLPTSAAYGSSFATFNGITSIFPNLKQTTLKAKHPKAKYSLYSLVVANGGLLLSIEGKFVSSSSMIKNEANEKSMIPKQVSEKHIGRIKWWLDNSISYIQQVHAMDHSEVIHGADSAEIIPTLVERLKLQVDDLTDVYEGIAHTVSHPKTLWNKIISTIQSTVPSWGLPKSIETNLQNDFDAISLNATVEMEDEDLISDSDGKSSIPDVLLQYYKHGNVKKIEAKRSHAKQFGANKLAICLTLYPVKMPKIDEKYGTILSYITLSKVRIVGIDLVFGKVMWSIEPQLPHLDLNDGNNYVKILPPVSSASSGMSQLYHYSHHQSIISYDRIELIVSGHSFKKHDVKSPSASTKMTVREQVEMLGKTSSINAFFDNSTTYVYSIAVSSIIEPQRLIVLQNSIEQLNAIQAVKIHDVSYLLDDAVTSNDNSNGRKVISVIETATPPVAVTVKQTPIKHKQYALVLNDYSLSYYPILASKITTLSPCEAASFDSSKKDTKETSSSGYCEASRADVKQSSKVTPNQKFKQSQYIYLWEDVHNSSVATSNPSSGRLHIRKVDVSTCVHNSDAHCETEVVASLYFNPAEEKVTSITTRDKHDASYMRTIGLADDSVLLKTLYPHILVITSISPPTAGDRYADVCVTNIEYPKSAENEERLSPVLSVDYVKTSLYVTLVDMVSGRILHWLTLDGATGPIYSAIIENNVIVTYWNANYTRTELFSLALYDGMVDKTGLVPWANKPAISNTNLNKDGTRSVSAFNIIPPVMQHKLYILPHGVTTLGQSSTTKGITQKHLLIGLNTHQVYAMDLRFVSPRRPNTAPTQQEKEEGLFQYHPYIQYIHGHMITYNYTLNAPANVITSIATGLESSSIVMVSTANELYATIIKPSGGFDSIPMDFSYGMLILLTAIMAILVNVLRTLYKKSLLNSMWT